MNDNDRKNTAEAAFLVSCIALATALASFVLAVIL